MPTKPKVWTIQDIPTPSSMAEYLGWIQAVRDAFPGVDGFPELPPDMNEFTFEKANDLERVLLLAHETIMKRKESRFYSGELQSGGV